MNNATPVTKYAFQFNANRQAFLYNRKYLLRRNVLIKIADEFKKSNVEWGIACSCGLFLLGIVDNFHDYDLLIAPKDFEKVCEIMERLGENRQYGQHPTRAAYFQANGYAEFSVDGLEIDVICEFGFTTFDSFYQYHFNSSEVKWVNLGTMELPVIPAEAQFAFYSMMTGWQPQRAFKRDLIAEYLKTGNLERPEILQKICEEDIPECLFDGIQEILK